MISGQEPPSFKSYRWEFISSNHKISLLTVQLDYSEDLDIEFNASDNDDWLVQRLFVARCDSADVYNCDKSWFVDANGPFLFDGDCQKSNFQEMSWTDKILSVSYVNRIQGKCLCCPIILRKNIAHVPLLADFAENCRFCTSNFTFFARKKITVIVRKFSKISKKILSLYSILTCDRMTAMTCSPDWSPNM